MRRIYATRTGLEAEEVRLFLESHGIHAHVSGGNNAFEVGFAFTPASEPGIFVAEADAERALGLLKDYRAEPELATQHGEWTCPACGEPGEEGFDICWKCEAPRPADAVISPAERSSDEDGDSSMGQLPAELSVPTPALPVSKTTDVTAAEVARSAASLWLEVALVLTITQLFFASGWLYTRFEQLLATSTLVDWTATVIATETSIATATLLIIARSGEDWSAFGLQRPRPLWDLCGAAILLIVTLYVVSISNGLFRDALRGWLPREQYLRLVGMPGDRFPLQDGFDLLIVLVVSLAVGFSEELVYRGYLIRRFEQLLKSTPVSVLLSTALFASVHFSGFEVMGVWNALGVGIIFGCVFAYFRRLWPLVFAHAIFDYMVITHHSRM